MRERKRKIEKERRVGVNEKFDELTKLLDRVDPLPKKGEKVSVRCVRDRSVEQFHPRGRLVS